MTLYFYDTGESIVQQKQEIHIPFSQSIELGPLLGIQRFYNNEEYEMTQILITEYIITPYDSEVQPTQTQEDAGFLSLGESGQSRLQLGESEQKLESRFTPQTQTLQTYRLNRQDSFVFQTDFMYDVSVHYQRVGEINQNESVVSENESKSTSSAKKNQQESLDESIAIPLQENVAGIVFPKSESDTRKEVPSTGGESQSALAQPAFLTIFALDPKFFQGRGKYRAGQRFRILDKTND